MLRRLLCASFATGGILLTTFASAQEPERLPPPAVEKMLPPEITAPPVGEVAPGEGCSKPMVDQNFPMKKIQIAEDQELIAVPRLPIREEVSKVPFVGLEIEYKEEKRSVTFMMPKPRKEIRHVTSVSRVPETTVDPCTGCPCTTYKEVPICRDIEVEVVDLVPTTREYVVQVPVLKPANKLAVVRRLVVDEVTVPAVAKTYHAVESEANITAPIPACAPAIQVPEHPARCGCVRH